MNSGGKQMISNSGKQRVPTMSPTNSGKQRVKHIITPVTSSASDNEGKSHNERKSPTASASIQLHAYHSGCGDRESGEAATVDESAASTYHLRGVNVFRTPDSELHKRLPLAQQPEKGWMLPTDVDSGIDPRGDLASAEPVNPRLSRSQLVKKKGADGN